MAGPYDVIVIGSGLGGLTAAALVAQAGRRTLLIERNHSFGGAASVYKAGDLVVEGSLHQTADPRDPLDSKHAVLKKLGVLDAVEWLPADPFIEVRGGPLDRPFVLPAGFAAARAALTARFPDAASGIDTVLAEMERIASGVGALGMGASLLLEPGKAWSAAAGVGEIVKDWHISVAERFDRAFGDNEAVKCALAGNIAYYHDDPAQLWWPFFAVAQGGFLANGGCYIRGGSSKLSLALLKVLRAAGGEFLRGRVATAVALDDEGWVRSVTHERRDGGDAVTEQTPVVIGNAAPGVLADLLPAAARETFAASYAERQQSISLFAATFGLSSPPSEIGITTYNTVLLPDWFRRLDDFRNAAAVLADMPGDRMPPLVIASYAAVDGTIQAAPYPVSVVGVDRLSNWSGLDAAAYQAKRDRWRDAIVAAIDKAFPGFAARVNASVFSTASTVKGYLNAPAGAVYGFAPTPPAHSVLHGLERSAVTAIDGLYLASAYAAGGGFTGAILGGAAAADRVLTT